MDSFFFRWILWSLVVAALVEAKPWVWGDPEGMMNMLMHVETGAISTRELEPVRNFGRPKDFSKSRKKVKPRRLKKGTQ